MKLTLMPNNCRNIKMSSTPMNADKNDQAMERIANVMNKPNGSVSRNWLINLYASNCRRVNGEEKRNCTSASEKLTGDGPPVVTDISTQYASNPNGPKRSTYGNASESALGVEEVNRPTTRLISHDKMIRAEKIVS